MGHLSMVGFFTASMVPMMLVLVLVAGVGPFQVSSVVIFSDDFESGNLNNWRVNGLASVTGLGAHSGKYSAMLGAASGFKHGSFELEKTLAVTPKSNLTVTFWFSIVNPDREGVAFPDTQLTATLSNQNSIIISDSLAGKRDFPSNPLVWKAHSLTVTVPPVTSGLSLKLSGKGGWLSEPGEGAILVDDISVSEAKPLTNVAVHNSTSISSISSSAQISSETQTASFSVDPIILFYVGVVAAIIMVGFFALKRRSPSGVGAKGIEDKIQKSVADQTTIRGERVTVSGFCVECGAKLIANARFCKECGTPVS